MLSSEKPRRVALRRLGRLCIGSSVAFAAPRLLLANAPDPVPEVLGMNHVSTSSSVWKGRSCLAVELDEEAQARALATGGNGPSYAIVSRGFSDGVIEVDIAGTLTGKGAAQSRAFVGVAFHIASGPDTYEAFYLRMTNGRLNIPMPPAPRIDRAIQYVAHPDFHYAVSREKFPGRYELGADIALGRWHRLRLEIQGSRARALVDGREVLVVEDLHYARRRGSVGLFVDDGTRGYFSRLSVLDSQ
jgi:hypothetical protein